MCVGLKVNNKKNCDNFVTFRVDGANRKATITDICWYIPTYTLSVSQMTVLVFL